MKYVDEKKSTNPKQFIDFRFSVQAFQKTFKTVSTNCANTLHQMNLESDLKIDN